MGGRQRWGRARPVGQGLCQGLRRGGAEGLLHPAAFWHPFPYSQLSLHDGHQKQTLQNKHTAPGSHVKHTEVTLLSDRCWISRVLMPRGTSQILALTFPSIPFRAGGCKEVCSAQSPQVPPFLLMLLCSPIWVSPASRSEGRWVPRQRAGHALDGPLPYAIKGVLREAQRAGSRARLSLSGQVCSAWPTARSCPGLQGHLSHQHPTQPSYSEDVEA